MDFIKSILISEYAWWIIAILLSILTIYITLQSIALGMPVNRFTQFMWLFMIFAWIMIFARNIVEYIISNTQSQIILVIIIFGYLLFAPIKKKEVKKRK